MSKSSPKSPLDAASLSDLMEKLQMRPPYLDTDALISKACDKVIEDEGKPKLAKEAAKLEQKIIRIILSGKGDTLKPNSGQSVEVGENHICVGCTERPESNYRVWQWHGHIMLFDEEKGFRLEYIYGNYFQRLSNEKPVKRPESSVLQELIEKADDVNARILCRNINLASK
ncbi:hypothetical protein KI387_026117, partial [Taxus chinensis]